ncbi:MAG: hypothetical protein NC324_06345 [Bacteroides sp.]|nr:hypothetical protein [Bacteroides sp.]
MKRMITLLATAGCLLFTTSCNKDNDKKQFATNKAGERLVEKIELIGQYTEDGHSWEGRSSTVFSYHKDGSIKQIIQHEGEDGIYDEYYTFETEGNTLFRYRHDNYDNTDDTAMLVLNEQGFAAIEKNEKKGDYTFEYDETNHLRKIHQNGNVVREFEWENGNLVLKNVEYTNTVQPNSNVDWAAYLTGFDYDYDDSHSIRALRFPLDDIFGILGAKNKHLISLQGDFSLVYEFDADGFISTIELIDHDEDASNRDHFVYTISYLKR